MLVLTRRPGEKICIGKEITCVLLQIRGNHVRVGIEAPPQVPIVRSELLELRSDSRIKGGRHGRKKHHAAANP